MTKLLARDARDLLQLHLAIARRANASEGEDSNEDSEPSPWSEYSEGEEESASECNRRGGARPTKIMRLK
eukprot:15447-Pleurochrysis_carterae.AAC.1